MFNSASISMVFKECSLNASITFHMSTKCTVKIMDKEIKHILYFNNSVNSKLALNKGESIAATTFMLYIHTLYICMKH